MPSRTFVRIACALAIVACGFALWAEPGSTAHGQVFTRNLADGAEIMFVWDSHVTVPFKIRGQGTRIVLHFQKPVTLRWGSSLEAVDSYIKDVQPGADGYAVILTLKQPSKAHYYYANSRDEDEKNGIELVSAPELQEAARDESVNPVPQLKKHFHQATHRKAIKKLLKGSAKSTAAIPLAEAAKLAALAPSAGAPTINPPAPVANVQAVPPPDMAALPLPFAQGEPFAIFTLHKNLWIVGDHFTPPSADELRKAGAPFIGDAKTLPDPHATILLIPLLSDVSASVEKTPEGKLNLVLAPKPAKLTQAFLPSVAQDVAGKSSLLIPAGKAAEMFSFRDPETGNILNIVPSAETGAGISSPRSFVELNLLPSAQGVAVQNLTDGLTVTLLKGIVGISAAGGLAISPETAQQLKEAESETAFTHLPSTLFPYARWKLDNEKNLVPAQIRLFNEIAFSSPEAANKARLKLLGLFLAEGMFPEALSMSDDILRTSLKFYQENKVSALRGAAHLFMYRISEAQRDFLAAELKGDPEAALWLSLCNDLLGEGKDKYDFSANYERYISHYPPSFIQKLAIMAADRDISRKEYDAANAIFETLQRDNYDEPVKKYVDYMRGKIYSETHSESEAAKIWEEQAKDLTDPLIRTRAEFSLVNMLLKDDKISHIDAIKRLEKLRVAWRGDSLELGVLTLLGDLYLDEKQYANALHTMRDIVLYFPQVPEAVTTARQMEETFVTLYNKDGADNMPPLEALGLFYEFRDLVPLGPSGDEMVRKLADRLVKIDLLDRASALLEHQIKNRLSGEERSSVGAKLAHVYLMNHKPDKALETLKTTGYGDLPPALQLERLRLTAQALSQQGKSAKAIDVISTDNSPEGTLLRLSIYWDTRDWPDVVSTAEDVLGNRNDPSAPLTPQESQVLLKLATAYVYEHDTGQLQYLRDYFTPLMKNNPNRDSFLFITSESGTVDYDNLANLEQDIGQIKTFLDKQEKPGKNGMSKAAN